MEQMIYREVAAGLIMLLQSCSFSYKKTTGFHKFHWCTAVSSGHIQSAESQRHLRPRVWILYPRFYRVHHSREPFSSEITLNVSCILWAMSLLDCHHNTAVTSKQKKNPAVKAWAGHKHWISCKIFTPLFLLTPPSQEQHFLIHLILI